MQAEMKDLFLERKKRNENSPLIAPAHFLEGIYKLQGRKVGPKKNKQFL